VYIGVISGIPSELPRQVPYSFTLHFSINDSIATSRPYHCCIVRLTFLVYSLVNLRILIHLPLLRT